MISEAKHDQATTCKPILFSTKMVMAILDGRKTCTRRIAKNIEKPPFATGDTLYVRETWRKIFPSSEPAEYGYMYRAGGVMFPAEHENRKEQEKAEYAQEAKWHPSLHMPKEAARIFLRVTDVHLEHLQDITEENAVREGLKPIQNPSYPVDLRKSARDAFAELWKELTGSGAMEHRWDANPLVWVIDFQINTIKGE